MKKLMKAIALATVMCMLMSVAAFASTAELVDEATKTLNISVTTATGSEQVSLIIVEAGKDIASENIVYAGQAAAVDGTASFTAKIAKEVEAVDVYSGNATYAAANSAKEEIIKNLSLKKEITEVAVEVVSTEIVSTSEAGADQNGGAVGMVVNFALPNGVTPVKVIWAVRTDDKVYYTPSIDISGLTALDGSIELGASFINGSVRNEIAAIEIDSADAIFLFSDDTEWFTNDDDIANRAE